MVCGAGCSVAPGGNGGGGALTRIGIGAGLGADEPASAPGETGAAGAASVGLTRSLPLNRSLGSSAGAALQPNTVHPPFSA